MSHGPNGTRGHKLSDAGIKRRWEDREAWKRLQKKKGHSPLKRSATALRRHAEELDECDGGGGS